MVGSMPAAFARVAPPTEAYQRAGGLSLVMDSQTMLARAASGVSPLNRRAFTRVVPPSMRTSSGTPISQLSGSSMPYMRAIDGIDLWSISTFPNFKKCSAESSSAFASTISFCWSAPSRLASR
ncbi:hypothetical protein D3C76_1010310 [compost metagenome]